MSIAPNLPTNIIKDTNIKFNRIFIKTSSSPSMCMDSTNQTISNNTQTIISNNICNIINTNQQYIYNPIKKQLINNNGLDNNLQVVNYCLDIDTNNKIKWSTCDLSNQNQQYIYKSNQFRNKNNLCVDFSLSKLNNCKNTSQIILLSNIIDNIKDNNNYIGDILNKINKLYKTYTDNYTIMSNKFYEFSLQQNSFFDKYNQAIMQSLPPPDIYNDPEFISIQKSKMNLSSQMDIISKSGRDIDASKQLIVTYNDYHNYYIYSQAINIYTPGSSVIVALDGNYNILISYLNTSNTYYNNTMNEYNNIINKYNI
jgi:hypothetical protein